MEKANSKLNLWIYFLSLVALIWANNASVPLWNADEAAYAGITKTMIETGDYLGQSFFQSDVHRKPPLHFWLMAISYAIFGVGEWAVRFMSGLSILLTLALVYVWVKKERDETTAWLSIGILGSNFLILALAKVAFVDAHLLLFTTVAGYNLFQILAGTHRTVHVVGLWLATALGLLVKGPPILIFLGLFFLFLMISKKSLDLIWKSRAWLGLPLAIVPFGIWIFLCYQTGHGEMMEWMWEWYVTKRAGGEAVFGQWGPPGYFALTFILAFAPFLTGLLLWIRKLVRKDWKTDHFVHYLFLWMLSGWVIYEVIPSKLPTYALASYPAIAIGVAIAIREVTESDWKSTWMRSGVFVQILLMACISTALVYVVQGQFGFWGLMISILTGLTGIITVIVYVLQLEAGQFIRSGKVLVWGSILFCFLLVLPVMNMIKEPLSCPKDVAQSIKLDVRKDDPILLTKYDVHMVSLPFYLSLEGDLDQISDRDVVAQAIQETKYRSIIADSSYIPILGERYRADATFSCLDQNTQKLNEYVVFILR